MPERDTEAMAVLSQFTNILPRFQVSQEKSLDWLSRCHSSSELLQESQGTERTVNYHQLFNRYGVKPSQISHRWTECPDILSGDNWNEKTIYRLTKDQVSGVDIEQRNRFFAVRANQVIREFYEKSECVPEHIVHVTCTGYISPSAVQVLVAQRNWQKVGVTHAYHMGCYASLPAVRIAEALSADLAMVDIIHTEMCSLHMDPAVNTPEQIVVQSLFADGHIKYSVSKKIPLECEVAFQVKGIREWILPDTEDDMTWAPAPTGMKMRLSRDVPEKIAAHLRSCFLQMANDCGLEPGQLLRDALFAVHPGGPKIIEAVERCLELRADQTNESHGVLKTRGNMSSATLPHIWQAILNARPASGTQVVSFAFGPGLTIFASLFEVVYK